MILPFYVYAAGEATTPADFLNPFTLGAKGIEKIYDWSKEDEAREQICIDTLGKYNCYAIAQNTKKFQERERNKKPDPYYCMMDSDWISKTGPDGSCPERKQDVK